MKFSDFLLKPLMNLDGMVKLQKMTIINNYKIKKFSIYVKKINRKLAYLRKLYNTKM